MRPASDRARRSRNSIWALVDRISSAAHFASASWTAGSSRSRMLLRSAMAASGVQRAGVDHLLGGLFAAQDDEQVGDHGGLPLLVEFDDVLLVEALQGQPHHADRAF